MSGEASFPARMATVSFSGKLLSLEELSALWGCSIRHLRRLVASGQLGFVKVGGLLRVPQVEAERFLGERFVASKAEEPCSNRGKLMRTGSIASLVDTVINRRVAG